MEENIQLVELLDYDNPRKAEYQRLVQESEKKQTHYLDRKNSPEIFGESSYDILHTNFDRALGRRFLRGQEDDPNCFANIIKKALKGNILIDLAGTTNLYDLAVNSKANMHIDVNRYFYEPEDFSNPFINLIDRYPYMREDIESSTEHFIVQADALDFVSRLQTGSACFTINGLDGNIINHPDYHKALANEVARATKENGIVFGVFSDSLQYLNGKFSIINPSDISLPIFSKSSNKCKEVKE